MKKNKNHTNGYTLTEMIVVLLILAILLAFIVPTLSGHIRQTRIKKYTVEAQGVFNSIKLYLIDKGNGDPFDIKGLGEELGRHPFSSKRNKLYPYLTVKCSKNAQFVSIALDSDGYTLLQFVYLVDQFEITLEPNKAPVVVDLRNPPPEPEWPPGWPPFPR